MSKGKGWGLRGRGTKCVGGSGEGREGWAGVGVPLLRPAQSDCWYSADVWFSIKTQGTATRLDISSCVAGGGADLCCNDKAGQGAALVVCETKGIRMLAPQGACRMRRNNGGIVAKSCHAYRFTRLILNVILFRGAIEAAPGDKSATLQPSSNLGPLAHGSCTTA